mmetsp:Transcript_61721/g.139720  ORF Transcript_61721/g.139720 Transcript_61721/m.139720 type:complete len:196 (-) Transcript_61721:212-799(-)|eukprot:CAMPEP_0172615986 /NCGR_PEP_ID=MMETSP1068-20121228/62637_1 /TAXON_ID=35684 /ORGANISM="Pseudopedinella elastica, Strain CCMP716" /LENGTH=195 /DNA_ID=CAMNT_0013421289 /DNA_START=149 /DNA_END=736 /DNA_ORIENTATION=-
MTHHQWRTSQETKDFIPRNQVPLVRSDPFHPKTAGHHLGNSLSYAPLMDKYTVEASESKYDKRKISSPFQRLHATTTHNTSPERIRGGGLVRAPERVTGRPMSSEAFFKPNKFDLPKFAARPMEFSHEFQVVREPAVEEKDGYRRPTHAQGPEDRPQSPLRIVRHEPKSSTLAKRNPDTSHRGVSRNNAGGYFAK